MEFELITVDPVTTPAGREQFVNDIIEIALKEWTARNGNLPDGSRANKLLKQALHRWVEEANL